MTNFSSATTKPLVTTDILILPERTVRMQHTTQGAGDNAVQAAAPGLAKTLRAQGYKHCSSGGLQVRCSLRRAQLLTCNSYNAHP